MKVASMPVSAFLDPSDIVGLLPVVVVGVPVFIILLRRLLRSVFVVIGVLIALLFGLLVLQQVGPTSGSVDARRCGQQATRTDPACDSVVIGESSRRTSEAAAVWGARYWPGLEGTNFDHNAVCRANEAWLRGEISNGVKIIDIGIDDSRRGTRSPYYELELRIIAEAGYPVEQRSWRSSPDAYEVADPGPCQ